MGYPCGDRKPLVNKTLVPGLRPLRPPIQADACQAGVRVHCGRRGSREMRVAGRLKSASSLNIVPL